MIAESTTKTTDSDNFERPEYSYYYREYLQEMISQIQPKPSNGTLDYSVVGQKDKHSGFNDFSFYVMGDTPVSICVLFAC